MITVEVKTVPEFYPLFADVADYADLSTYPIEHRMTTDLIAMLPVLVASDLQKCNSASSEVGIVPVLVPAEAINVPVLTIHVVALDHEELRNNRQNFTQSLAKNIWYWLRSFYPDLAFNTNYVVTLELIQGATTRHSYSRRDGMSFIGQQSR